MTSVKRREFWSDFKRLIKIPSPMRHQRPARDHQNDVIMGSMASQITSLTIVYSTVYSGADQRKHQSRASLAFVRGIHREPLNSPHKEPVTGKMFPFDDIIMFAQMIQNTKMCLYTIRALLCFVMFSYLSILFLKVSSLSVVSTTIVKQCWGPSMNKFHASWKKRHIAITKNITKHNTEHLNFTTALHLVLSPDTGPRLNIKTVLSTYGDFHVKDETAVRTSYL